jgi:glycosyltransferase involved in cell wall biosynthesis
MPLVISTRGMLSGWALDQKRRKKQVAWRLYQRRDLRSAHLLHATSATEVEDIRQAGLRQPVAVIPNGVEVPGPFRSSAPTSPREALFLSRLHPGKGALDLVRAWARVRPEGWRLVLAGPDEDGHRANVERAVRELGLEAVTRFAGPVGDDEKWDLYRRADLFVLPTASENFGIVVAEALAAGTPVVTTKGAPWRVLEERACGWWIDRGVEPLEAALREATALDDDTRRAMGVRGRAYAEANLSWEHIAEEMAAAYRWVLGNGERPAAIAMD